MTARYADLGIRPVINAAATLTRLGGSRMPPPVLDAMRAAAEAYVDLPELQQHVGKRIAQLTHNEACYVSSGAAAGMAVAIAALVAGKDSAKIMSLPAAGQEVITFRSMRNGYAQAARMAGTRLLEIERDDLETSFTENTTCVLYFAGKLSEGSPPLEDVVGEAHARNVPVVVDAAAQIPPITNLWHFTQDLGVDAVIFSGGKGLRGPQSTGLILGKRTIIEACQLNGPPNHSLGRPMKVGKEEMLGILAAVEWSLQQDEAAAMASYEVTVQRWIVGLQELPHVRVERRYPSEAGQPHGRAIVHLLPDNRWTRETLITALWDGQPRIAVGETDDGGIALNPQTVDVGEAEIVLQTLRTLLSENHG